MENNRSYAKKKLKNIQNNIREKTPKFLISDQKTINIVTIAKHDDEIVINCDNENHKTIPDSVFNYLCSTNSLNKDNTDNSPNDNTINHKSNIVNTNKINNESKDTKKKVTKSKITSRGGKKTRRKNKK